MPILQNAKHEVYANARACGMSRQEALALADLGQESSGKSGYGIELDRRADIIGRIREIQQEAVERTLMTIERLTLMLLEDRDLARDKGQVGAAVNAVEKIAKLHGYMVEKKEIKHSLADGIDPKKLSEVRDMLLVLGTETPAPVSPPPPGRLN